MITPNVEQLLTELERQTENLNKEIRFRKQAEFLSHQHIDILESKAKEIRLFANVAAHGLQEPLKDFALHLQNLKGYYQSQKQAKDNPSLQSSFDILENSITRMQTLIDVYLEYSLITIDKVAFVPISMIHVLELALENIADIIKKDNVHIEYDKTSWEACPHLLGDEQLLASVFQEIISNAIRYRSDDPIHIELTLELQPGLCMIAIKDNGQGIDPKYYEQIFWAIKPDKHSGEYQRNSIGLAISKKAIEHHGGKIWVSSVINLGSTFFITLPIPVTH